MTTPGGQISIYDVLAEVGLNGNPAAYGNLSFLNGYIRPDLRPGSPNLNSFQNLTYYQNNSFGANCPNGNCACDCNCGNVDCSNCTNCYNINCGNCDGQAWLQNNCNCACVYNCNPSGTVSHACNCSKIICTKLFELKKLPEDIYLADQKFGEQLRTTNPDVYNGYIAWANHVVNWMNGNGIKMYIVSDEKLKSWSINWAEKIATPWAEHMAYLMGTRTTDNKIGKTLMLFGKPVSKFIGVIQRKISYKKKDDFLTGAILIFVLTFFRLVVFIGNLFNKGN